MNFSLCENTGFYLRLGLIGPSGSGKSYTALKVATGLGYERIGVIDTENRSARRYAKSFSRRFLSLELSNFSPKDYIAAIAAAQKAGIEVLVIDSLSHAWMGKGGVLEMVDNSARRQSRGSGSGSSFNGWREVTPEHNNLVQAMIQAPMHLIVTMRVKTDYVVEKDAQGKSVPRKVGLAPVQRDGLEYEFDIVGDLSPDHELAITKSRCPKVADQILKNPGEEFANNLRAWMDGAEPAPPREENGEAEHARPPQVLTQAQELAEISPWLQRIHHVEENGSEEQLDEVREEMNAALKKRTRTQGEVLRRAIEMAKAAIRARQGALFSGTEATIEQEGA